VSAPALADTSRISAEGIYGSLAVAVVCLAWNGDSLGDLAVEIIVYSVALWAFHVYARVLHGGWTQRSVARVRYWASKEWPHIEAAVPALLVVLGGWALGLDPVRTSDLAMGAALVNLLVWQLALLVPERPSGRTLVVTLALDGAVITALLLLRLAVK
jgi:hypothetical protein